MKSDNFDYLIYIRLSKTDVSNLEPYCSFIYSQFSSTLNLFNTNWLLIPYLEGGIFFAIFFDFSFKIIKNGLLRFITEILILGLIALKIVFQFIDYKQLEFLKDWLYLI